MAWRWGLGPVFLFEWRLASRRWQFYAGRVLFVALLLGALSMVWWEEVVHSSISDLRQLALVGKNFFLALIGTQITLVLLAAPAATAGAICLDKARGGLLHLLMTDLSDGEIVLGKLAGRLVPVIGLVACSLPVVFGGVLLGGIDPEALIGAYLVSLGLAVFGCALALTLSVWGTKTHEVLLATYLVLILVLLANWIWGLFSWIWSISGPPAWFSLLNPYLVAFRPYLAPGSGDLSEAGAFLGAAGVLSVLLVAVAVARVRAVTVRQAGRPEQTGTLKTRTKRPWRRWLSPSLDGNPVLWREWHRRRPSRWVRIVWSVYAILGIFFTAVAIWFSTGTFQGLAPMVNGLQVAVGMLLMSVSAVTALAEERVQGSLDVLLATPLSTRAIVWGKWWGAFRTVPRLAVLPGILAGVMAVAGSQPAGILLVPAMVLAYGAALTSLGLALATWISRLARAVAVSVTAYVLVTVGSIFAITMVAASNQRDLGESLAMGSPFFGPGEMTWELAHTSEPIRHSVAAVIWIGLYAAVALVLLLATVATFDGCLGRMPPFTSPRKRRRPVRPLAGAIHE